MQIKTLNANQAVKLLQEGEVKVVDVRDKASFNQGRIKTSTHLTNENLAEFMAATSHETPVLVCCYSGFASQNAAAFLQQKGYQQVYSLDGGFNAWQVTQPDLCE